MFKIYLKFLLIGVASFFVISAHAKQNPAGFEVFDGLWGWVPEKSATCKKNPHTLTFSKDLKEVYLEFTNSKDKKGNHIKNVAVYSVHEIKKNSVTMSVHNERRMDDEGNPVVWDLVLLSEREYKWHRHDWTFYKFTASVVKCD